MAAGPAGRGPSRSRVSMISLVVVTTAAHLPALALRASRSLRSGGWWPPPPSRRKSGTSEPLTQCPRCRRTKPATSCSRVRIRVPYFHGADTGLLAASMRTMRAPVAPAPSTTTLAPAPSTAIRGLATPALVRSDHGDARATASQARPLARRPATRASLPSGEARHRGRALEWPRPPPFRQRRQRRSGGPRVMNPAAKTASAQYQAVGMKCGASWSRTSDLTLIRGAL